MERRGVKMGSAQVKEKISAGKVQPTGKQKAKGLEIEEEDLEIEEEANVRLTVNRIIKEAWLYIHGKKINLAISIDALKPINVFEDKRGFYEALIYLPSSYHPKGTVVSERFLIGAVPEEPSYPSSYDR